MKLKMEKKSVLTSRYYHMGKTKHQKGAALIVVLSLLAMSLMIGLSGINSSLINERLAGNYKASAQAQMGAEIAASAGWDPETITISYFGETSFTTAEELHTISWDEFIDNKMFHGKEPSGDACSGDIECRFRYIKLGGNNYMLAMGVVGNAASDPIIVNIVSGDGLSPKVEATLTCVGARCNFSPPSGRSGSAVDGRNYSKEGKTTGANRPSKDEGGVAAIIMSHGIEAGSPDCLKNPLPSICGDQENAVSYDSKWASEENKSWDIFEKTLLNEIEMTKEFVQKNEPSGGVQYIGQQEKSGPKIDEGIIFVDGGTLSWEGGSNFKGLVVMNGGVLSLGGTATVLGAVIGKDYTVSMGGNSAILYSSEAIESFVGPGASGGSSGRMSIDSWI